MISSTSILVKIGLDGKQGAVDTLNMHFEPWLSQTPKSRRWKVGRGRKKVRRKKKTKSTV